MGIIIYFITLEIWASWKWGKQGRHLKESMSRKRYACRVNGKVELKPIFSKIAEEKCFEWWWWALLWTETEITGHQHVLLGSLWHFRIESFGNRKGKNTMKVEILTFKWKRWARINKKSERFQNFKSLTAKSRNH